MKKWFNLLFGYAVIQVTGAYPERFLNLCAQNRRGFWRLRWPDAHTVQVRVHLSDLEELKELAGRCGCTLEVHARRGGVAQAQRLGEIHQHQQHGEAQRAQYAAAAAARAGRQ